jgi:hypothetical protein
MKLPPEFTLAADMTEQEAMLTNMINRRTPEAEGEAYVDGTWVVAHVAMRPELFANVGRPITKFGEDSIDMTFELIPGTIRRFESIPLRLGIGLEVGMKAGMWLAPGVMEQANIHLQKRYLGGRKIIEEAGGVEAYDRSARIKYGLSTSITGLKDDDALVFEE